MKIQFPGLLLISFLIIITTFSCQKDADFLEGELPSEGESLLDLAVEERAMMGVAAAYNFKDTLWKDAAGLSDASANELFTNSTITRLASIAKPMTAIGILQLVESGELNLDAPIQDYLPEFPIKPEGVITTRHLLNHSSGIQHYKNENEVENQTEYATLEDALTIFKDRELLAVPGTSLHYSSYGYVVLGRIIEKISQLDYETYMQENIWDPAGMINTSLEHANQFYSNKSALYYRKDNGNIQLVDANNLSNRHPGGGIQSNLEDMINFGNALIDNKLIKRETLMLMFESFPDIENEGLPYGFGWRQYESDPSLGSVHGHEGTQTGASTVFMIYPEEDFFAVVLSNTSKSIEEVFKIIGKLFEINFG